MKFRALLPGCKRPSALDLEVFGKECRALLQVVARVLQGLACLFADTCYELRLKYNGIRAKCGGVSGNSCKGVTVAVSCVPLET